MFVGWTCWLASFLVAWSHQNMSNTWSLAISYQCSSMLVPACVVCLATSAFLVVSEQCGANAKLCKATTRFYWLRSEGVDRFVVDWCWMGDGFAMICWFWLVPETWLRAYLLKCQQNQEPWQLIIMPHPHLWNVGSFFVRHVCKRACCGQAGSKPKRAGFWKGSLFPAASSWKMSRRSMLKICLA